MPRIMFNGFRHGNDVNLGFCYKRSGRSGGSNILDDQQREGVQG